MFAFAGLMAALMLAGCQSSKPPALMPRSPAPEAGLSGSLGRGTARLNERAALSLVSTYRRGHGLPALAYDPTLMADAKAVTLNMVHTGRLARHGAATSERFVDVAAGHDTLADAFSGWRYAPASRAHMLNKNMHRFAMAAVYAPHSRYRVFWTMILAR